MDLIGGGGHEGWARIIGYVIAAFWIGVGVPSLIFTIWWIKSALDLKIETTNVLVAAVAALAILGLNLLYGGLPFPVRFTPDGSVSEWICLYDALAAYCVASLAGMVAQGVKQKPKRATTDD
ncbi:MAG TPA: hypothetical protein VKX17_17665 [Planctomycetota bacterium]|nr:hypothetical protein [Planctomycetota bacterium]